MLARMQRNWISRILLRGMQNGTSALENSLVDNLKTKYIHNSSIILFSIYPTQIKICLHKELYINIHSCSTYNNQKVEITQMSFS